MKAKTLRCGMGVLGMVLIGLTALVQAHTKLEKSEPRAGATVTVAPTRIQLSFDEKIDVAVSKIELTSASGRVDLGPARAVGDKTLAAVINGKVADGPYTVAWQTAGDDGHAVKGDFTFAVKLAR